MSISQIPFRIAQISDIHCGEPTFNERMLSDAIEKINEMEPDIVVVAGDLTGAGYEWEYDEAARWLEQIRHPKVVVPGNHDARNVGYVHFENVFGERFSRYRKAFDAERAELLGATGFTVVAVDSSEPDVNDGRVGREHYEWIAEQFDEPDDLKIFVIHHHLVPIPGTGRERNIILDAGDVLAVLTQLDIDVVLSGHKHVPYFWGVNGVLLRFYFLTHSQTRQSLRGLKVHSRITKTLAAASLNRGPTTRRREARAGRPPPVGVGEHNSGRLGSGSARLSSYP